MRKFSENGRLQFLLHFASFVVSLFWSNINVSPQDLYLFLTVLWIWLAQVLERLVFFRGVLAVCLRVVSFA